MASTVETAAGTARAAEARMIKGKRGYSHMIVACPNGHERVEYFKMGVPLLVFCDALKAADSCPTCGSKGCGVLQGTRYQEAVARLTKEQPA